MYFEEAFGKIKASLEKSKVKAEDGHFAIQVRLTDYDCGGTFYIEQKDGKFYVEPYNYFDFDADVEAAYGDIKALADGKLDMQKALDEGKLIVNGNLAQLLSYGKGLKKPVRKTAAKKATAEKKPTAAKKSACAKKTTVKAEKTESKTAEKETKPKKAAKKQPVKAK